MTENSSPKQPTPAATTVPGAGVKAATQPAAAAAPSMPPPAASAEIIERLMRQRIKRLAWRFGLFVLLPTVLAGIYFTFVATRQYETVATILVQEAAPLPDWNTTVSLGAPAGALPQSSDDAKHKAPSSTPARDATAIKDFFGSKAAFEQVNKELHLVDSYASPKVDWLSRLHGRQSLQKGYSFYLDMVSSELDPPSGVVTLRVKGFDRDLTQEVAKLLVKRAESNLNRVWRREYESRRARAAALEASTGKAFAEAEVAARAAEQQAALEQPSRPRSPTASATQPAAQPLASLSVVVAREQLATAAAAHHWASVTRLLAEEEATRLHRYVVEVAQPTKPDAPVYPRPLRSTLAVLLLSLLTTGVLSLLIAAVKEHAQI
jgi:capsular polysaccharide transport system permease protein